METSFFNVPSNHRSRTAPSSLRISPVGGKQHEQAPRLISLLRRTVAAPLFSPVFSGELVTAVEAASGDGDPSFLFGVCKEHSSAATAAQCRATMAEKKNNQN
nr:hypothetical protein Itr_chr14CG24050 [Ipomoea trifida]